MTVEAPTRLETLSPSRAGDFKICPQLFKFRAIDRLEEPTTVHQARGTTAHLALQWLFDLPSSERTPQQLFDLFRQAWTQLRDDDEYEGIFGDIGEERAWGLDSLRLLSNYFGIEDPTRIDPVDRELDMTEDLDGIVIRGILDRIDRGDDGRLIITDYKTGKAPPERFAFGAFFALKIYALLIRRRLDETPARTEAAVSQRAHHLPVSDRRRPTRRYGSPAQSVMAGHRTGSLPGPIPSPTGSFVRLVLVPGPMSCLFGTVGHLIRGRCPAPAWRRPPAGCP